MSNRKCTSLPSTERLIFLDFDGVLNDPYWLTKVWSLSHEPGFFELDPARLELLSQICYLTGAKIVLASSWNMRDGLTEFFEKLGFEIAGKLGYHSDRGKAIETWIAENCTTYPDYIILDDEKSDYSEDQLKHLVWTADDKQMWTQENIHEAPKKVGLRKKHLKEIEKRWSWA